jgi:hypothetical protein
MKNIQKIYKPFLWLLFMAGVMSLNACKEEDPGMPEIVSVRLIDPEQADNKLTGGPLLGETIVIEGKNLANVQTVLINDFEVYFNPALITNSTIVVTVPSDAPTLATAESVSNTIKVVTPNGTVSSFNFELVPPPPVIASIGNEMANVGETIRIYGSYLYVINKITFPGGIEATSFTYDPLGNYVDVVVPSGATTTGVIAIETLGGATDSGFSKFRDVSGLLTNYDDRNVTGWGFQAVSAASNPTNPVPVSGNYVRLYKEGVGAPKPDWWDGGSSIIADADWAWGSYTFPTDVTGAASKLALKFEMFAVETWNSGYLEIALGSDSQFYRYEPWKGPGGTRINIKSTGWTTVTIPLSNFAGLSDYSQISGLKFFKVRYINPDADNGGIAMPFLNLALDNFRFSIIAE